MKISDIVTESMGVGGVAVVAQPVGGMQRRAGSTKKKKKKATEDSPQRQMSIYNPDGKTYKGKPMPNMDDGDPNNQGQEYGNFDDNEFAYDHDLDRDIDNRKRDQKIASLLKTLNPQEQKVLKLRFEDDMSYEQVGEVFGVTRERIRQIEAKALRKLRHPDRSDQLRPHVGEGNKAQKGIPANATDAELKSARSAGGEKGQRAHWLLNMRKGNKKK